MFNLPLIKKSAILSLTGFFLPIAPLLYGIAGLVILDIITGMYVARFVKGEGLTSRRFFDKIKQVGLVGIGLAAMLFADQNLQVLGLTEFWGAKLFCALYTFYELFSVLENLGSAGLPIAKEIKGLLLNKKNEALDKEKEDGKNE